MPSLEISVEGYTLFGIGFISVAFFFLWFAIKNNNDDEGDYWHYDDFNAKSNKPTHEPDDEK